MNHLIETEVYLNFIRNSIKRLRRSILINKIMNFVFLFLIIYQVFYVIYDFNNKIHYFNILSIICCSGALILNLTTRKNNKKILNGYYEELKELDYPSYLRLQRKEKLKKIKKFFK